MLFRVVPRVRLLSSVPSASATLNWSGLSSALQSKESKDALFSLRRTLDDLDKELSSVPETPETVDFAAWRASLSAASHPVVAAYASALSAASSPSVMKPFANPLAADARSAFLALEAQAADAARTTESTLRSLQNDLAALDARRNQANTTVEEELAKNPAVAAAIANEINDDNWTYGGAAPVDPLAKSHDNHHH
ncbi:mitochondrial Complex V (CV) F1Fo ATP synthase Fo subunit d (Atp7) [Andalucia godoyi]|uniref:Mitochondrial Complex V (CV) F1Fo ATP synthase Fo subunit d (Atp7) n=1 Tax=Andalucia godoyi TaxID=505711 RepID=A0A8K0F458_ANDGO|nr:mitochondrial Complex V (CV) F1Fo ATP synthase Fo subunit d (Atp7) [Andalucia godoyi]|eukprot:ANDGO_06913.mRNA.1 mitochondrial Complex V (CV) F1Fo ATP synthase Fo subunit d (Atp7)